jgi:hypothetical protein
MLASAIATGCIDFVLPLDRIAPALIAVTMARGRRPVHRARPILGAAPRL